MASSLSLSRCTFAGIFEHSQMLRDRRAADRELPRQIDDRARSIRQPFQNGQPGGITQCQERGISVSHDRPSLYTYQV